MKRRAKARHGGREISRLRGRDRTARSFGRSSERRTALAPSLVYRANINPSVGLLHMLLTVALTRGSVAARLELALVDIWSVGVLVIDVEVPLFLSRPASLKVLADGFRAFPGT
jgi:hypothetical protein